MVGRFGVLVVGGGMAGASAAANLASSHSVAILEREDQPGIHSTGRSAALFSEIYGNAPVRALTRASRRFLFEPPPGFAESRLTAPRGALHIARADQMTALHAFAALPDVAATTRLVDASEALALSPLLRADYAAAAVHEPQARDIDVHALHQGYLRQLRAGGGRVITRCGVTALDYSAGLWRVTTDQGALEAPVIVNAAGAWADRIGAMAGLAPVGLTPCRRTAITVDAPAAPDIAASPMTLDIGQQFYFKPDAGKLLLSPADETPSEPCDAQPDELDIATVIDRVERATILKVTRVRSKWAGLRSFVADRTPVVGYDPACTGFFWLAGQGGYGIQTAPALGRLAAALVRYEPPPADLLDCGLEAGLLSVRDE
jgi:D-arginine dehydrogenase